MIRAKFELDEAAIKLAIAAHVGGIKGVNASPAHVKLEVLEEADPVTLAEKFRIVATVELFA